MSTKNKWEKILLDNTSVVLAASETNRVVSEVFAPTYLDTLNLRVSVKVENATVTTSVGFNLQQSPDGQTWTNVKSANVPITANGWFHLLVNVEAAADQGQTPLLPFLRVVTSTSIGDAVTVSDVRCSRRG